MNLVIFDEDPTRSNLLPFTFTRPVAEIRVGILTIREKWERYLDTSAGHLTQNYLSVKFKTGAVENALFVNGKLMPDASILEAVQALQHGEALWKAQDLLAWRGAARDVKAATQLQRVEYNGEPFCINYPWDIFQKNGRAITDDMALLTRGRVSEPLSPSVTVIGDRNLVFLEKGAKAEACVLNTSSGPIYLGEDAEIMEGSLVRGPFALCAHSALKLGTKIYGPTTIGPHCKVGGEVNNSVIFGYSNKAHDGFLGNSVIAEWCNLGADTNNSNLKNNYGNVKLFSYAAHKAVDTGLQFCGLMMGDHSKSGINTMFNTGTVVGVAANIYGGGFPETHIPSFSWGGADGFETYRLDKLYETAERVFERRGLMFDQVEKDILKAVFERTA